MKALKEKYVEAMTADIPPDLVSLKEELSLFYTYPDAYDWNVQWDEKNNEFLKEIGVPESAPTMINFQAKPKVEDLRISIGFNNYGDRLFVLKESGNLVFENHDFNNRLEYLNKDAVSFFRTVCAFTELMRGNRTFPERMKEIDPDAFQEDTWWHREYLSTIEEAEQGGSGNPDKPDPRP
ncbi:MAG: hypothetical protein SynsKO_29830 [Synoicihabitans sp.]